MMSEKEAVALKDALEKGDAFLQCAYMILDDACPPDRNQYLCKVQEDDIGDCIYCWRRYLRNIACGIIEPFCELYTETQGATA